MAWNLIVILVLFALSVLLFLGAVKFASKMQPIALTLDAVVCGATLAFCVFVLAPCALFNRTRMFSAIGLRVAGYVFAGATWLFAVMVVYYQWKLWGLVAGLMLGVVGVIPLALIAALSKALWTPSTLITAGLVVTAGAFLAATYVSGRLKQRFV